MPGFTANDLYGGIGGPQPDPAAARAGVPAVGTTGDVKARTERRADPTLTGNPTLALVALLAIAALLINFSVRVEVSG